MRTPVSSFRRYRFLPTLATRGMSSHVLEYGSVAAHAVGEPVRIGSSPDVRRREPEASRRRAGRSADMMSD
jgi:hypothetical protein